MVWRFSRWLRSAICLMCVTMAWPQPLPAFDDVFLGVSGDDTRILGRDRKDYAGSALAVGDVSGDGRADLLIGAPLSDGVGNSRDDSGEVAVIFGAVDLPPTIRIQSAQHTFFGASEFANLGDAVAVGDLNGDGVDDVIMGAPKGDGPEQGGSGAVYVFYGGLLLPTETSIDLEDAQAHIILFGGQDGGRFGRALATGDFNDDGFDDLAISAPLEGRQFERPKAGVVYVFFGRPDLNLGAEFFAGPSVPFSLHAIAILGPTVDARGGRALAVADLNGDGVDDLVIGTTVEDPVERAGSGDVYVLFGGGSRFQPDPVELVEIDLADPAQVDLRILGPQAGDNFGRALGIADINGDLQHDILVGASGSAFGGGLVTGRAYAFFGPFQRRAPRSLAVEPANVMVAGPHEGARLGESVSGGDMNGDGFDEWIVGAPGADRAGQAYRIVGRQQWSPMGAYASLTQGKRGGDEAGAATAVGDVNGDGIADLVVTSPLFDGQPFSNDTRDAGAVYIVLGEEGPVIPGPDCVDADGDGFRVQGRTCGPVDCNDNDPEIQLGVGEFCTDCDGLISFDGPDNDEDGWPSQADSVCVIPDCDDDNPAVNPGVPEVCTDGIDNDCDGAIDGIDTSCGGPGPGPGTCDESNPAVDPGGPEICDDGIDNDCDGAIDDADTECEEPGPCDHPQTSEVCDDGIDNDCDGAIDDADTDCGGSGPVEICSNCVDDDGNGLTDMLDPACTPTPLTVKAAVVRRPKKAPTMIKRIVVKTSLPDAALLTAVNEPPADTTPADELPADNTPADASALPTTEAEATPSGVIVGLAFDEGSQFCLQLDNVKRRAKKKITTFSNGTHPVAKLRVKETRKGLTKVTYKQKGKVELPTPQPTAMAFGIYSSQQPYRGLAPLKAKSASKLVAVKTPQ